LAVLHFLNITLETLAENLALDEALLLQAEGTTGSGVLRIWEWRDQAVVLGAGSRLAEDVDETACRADGVAIGRRSSGGGTVLLCPGCLCYTLVLPYERSAHLSQVRSSFCYILEHIKRALADFAPGIELAGTSDLAMGGRKFSGNAQQRKRTHLLHHGTLLYDFDFRLAGRYLRMPARQPAYRQRRQHADFLLNLPVSSEQLTRRLRHVCQAETDLVDWPRDLVQRLAGEKYSRPEWIRRR
jgi:lipoate---protein ligase